MRAWDKRRAGGLVTGGQDEFSVQVAAGQPLMVTLVWSDAPSSLAAATNLVNDLDLEVAGPVGTYLGNAFSGGQSATGGTRDSRNNVEQVLLNAPAAGTYTLRVKGTSVPGNGFTPQSDRQGYALVARFAGCATAVVAAPAGMTATDNATTGIALSWGAVTGATRYEIFRAPGTCGYSLTQACFKNADLSAWTLYSHDLSAYASQTVLIRWNFSADGRAEFEGFYLDDIQVTLASTPRDHAHLAIQRPGHGVQSAAGDSVAAPGPPHGEQRPLREVDWRGDELPPQ